MKPIVHWGPALFCAFLSLIALIGSVTDAFGMGNWWTPTFYANLPICFYLVGAHLSRTSRELNELRERILQLERQAASEARTLADG